MFAACWLKIRPSHGLRSGLSPSLAYGPDDLFFGPQGQSPFYGKVSAVKILDFEQRDDPNSSYALVFEAADPHTELPHYYAAIHECIHPSSANFQVDEPEICAVFLT